VISPAYFRSLAARLFRRSRTDRELAEELRSHVAYRADDLERSGLDRAEAERRARVELGNSARLEEECREALGGAWIDTVIQDARFGVRMLRKSPAFAAVAILTIALGVGATTAIFSVVDSTLIHPLPYPRPEQLVRIEDDLPGAGARDVGLSQPEWKDLGRSGIFTYVSPAWYDDNNLTGGSRPLRVSLTIVAPNYFSLLGVKPRLGRAFDPEYDAPGFVPEVVISDGLWNRAFGRDPAILRRSLRMDTDLYRVVGVMPPGYHDPGRTARDRNIEVWAATSFYGPPLFDHPPRNGRNLPTAIGRLKSGLTIAAAQSRVNALVAALRKQFPGDYPQQSGWTVRLVPLKESVVGDVRRALLLLFGAVALVLLIGCVNVANLLLARASARGREMAIRRALGAGRARLTRQMLTESLVLSLAGGAAGAAILFGVRKILLRIVPESLPRFGEASINGTVLLFALGASVLAGAIFGLAPVLQIRRLNLVAMLKREGRGSTGSGEQARARRTLVVTEFALSLVLMIAASLLLESFRDLLKAPLGFDPRRVMTVRTRLPYPNDAGADVYPTASRQTPLFRGILRGIRSLKGVEEAAIGDLGAVPLGHDRKNQSPPFPLILEGGETRGNDAPRVDGSIVSPEYFHLMGMPLLRGRLFGDLDRDSAPAVAVINAAMARAYWPGGEALGKRIKLSRRATEWTTIVGIVANARTETLEDSGVPQVYADVYQKGAKHLAIFLRGNLDAAAIPEAVRELVQSLDPTLPVFGAQMLDETVSASLAARRFSMEIVALFALTALLLAGLGIYGVMAYMVNERTHEIGIRLALGAGRRNVLRLVLRQGLGLAVAGSAVGLAGALIVTRLMAGLLYGVKATDPATFAGVAGLLIAVALLACYLPARRATRVDPIVALRYE
jgi:predicted permease